MVDISRDVSDLAAIYNLLGFEAPSFVDNSAENLIDVDVECRFFPTPDNIENCTAKNGQSAVFEDSSATAGKG